VITLKKVLIKDVGKVITGNTPSKKNVEFYDSNDIGFAKPDGIAATGITLVNTTKEYISEKARKKARVVEKGTVFVTCIGTIGKMGIVDSEELAFNQQINAIVPNDNVLSKYLAYNMLSNKEKLEAISNAPVVPIINKTQFENFEITIHDNIIDQDHIVKVLDNLTKIIDNRKTQIEEYNDLIKSRFVELFGDIKNNVIKCQVKKIGDFTDVLTGATPKRDNPEYFGGTFPWVKTGEISKGIILDAVEYITEKAIKETSCKLLPIDTIMVAMYGQGKTRGQTGILGIEASTNQACAAIIPNTDYNSLFMYRQLELRYDDLREMGRGGNQPNLNLSMVRNFEVLFPDINAQNHFSVFAQQVDKLKVKVRKSLDEIQVLFDSLMQEYFE